METFVGDPRHQRAVFGVLLARAACLLVDLRERRRARLAFASLNAYWLRDIGVEPRLPDTTVERIRTSGRPWF